MSLEQKLLATPVGRWVTRQAVVLDWYDGPREGVCALETPAVEFLFELLAEHPNHDDIDDRLFLVREVPPGTVDALVQDLRELGEPAQPVWVPVWQFKTDTAQTQAEQRIRKIQAAAPPGSLIVSTRDLRQFLECWMATPAQRPGQGWSSLLGVAPSASAS